MIGCSSLWQATTSNFLRGHPFVVASLWVLAVSCGVSEPHPSPVALFARRPHYCACNVQQLCSPNAACSLRVGGAAVCTCEAITMAMCLSAQSVSCSALCAFHLRCHLECCLEASVVLWLILISQALGRQANLCTKSLSNVFVIPCSVSVDLLLVGAVCHRTLLNLFLSCYVPHASPKPIRHDRAEHSFLGRCVLQMLLCSELLFSCWQLTAAAAYRCASLGDR